MPNENAVESVWDYPRPPRLERTSSLLRVLHRGVVLAETTAAFRILETSHPPVFYIPPADIAMQHMVRSPSRSTFCEFKGIAIYWSINVAGAVFRDAAWSYQQPAHPYKALKDHIAFYANRVDECSVDGEIVQAQAGDFYGGWITSKVKGPFKGAPGTMDW